ncbi:MAG: hypothetical protein HUK20_12830 [Fibrobacter sp.]|nr:hypothetical protein [Fibrobacter sp.]
MKGIQEYMKTHGDKILCRVNGKQNSIEPPTNFMMGYKYLLVRQGNQNIKSKFQACENINEVNYFINLWNTDFGYNGEYAVYEMIHFASRID